MARPGNHDNTQAAMVPIQLLHHFLGDDSDVEVVESSSFFLSFFILKRQTIEQVQCDMQCDVYATCDMNHSEQQTDQKKGCLFLIRSLNEGLDVRVAVGTQTIVLAEAHTSHMDDLCITRMVALVTVGPPSLRAVVTWRSYFFQVYLLGVVVLRRAIASTVSMNEMHPHLMLTTLKRRSSRIIFCEILQGSSSQKPTARISFHFR